ncbi:MAG: Fur family transcriptional regulator [Nitrospirota bacterium]
MQNKPQKQLSQFLAGQGLRLTVQRERILEVFLKAKKHVSAEDLYAQLRKTDPGIGYATIYRTLKLLAEAGLAEERRFHDGFTRFEYKESDIHHDHLICTRCGSIMEFENERIEALQHDVAKKRGFQVASHKLELYGLCNDCLKKDRLKNRNRLRTRDTHGMYLPKK